MLINIDYNSKVNLSARLNTVNDSRKVVILLHGLSIDKNTEPIPSLENRLNNQGFNTLSFDLYGHGKSSGKFRDITITKGLRSLEKVFSYLNGKGFNKFCIIAESFSGHLAIIFSSKYSIECLILKSAVADYIEIENNRRSKKILDDWKKNDKLEFVNGFGVKKELSFSFHENIYKYDGFKSASQITARTLILHGQSDNVVPVKQACKLHKLIKGCQLIIYPDSGHKIHLDKYADKMYKDIIGFVRVNF